MRRVALALALGLAPGCAYTTFDTGLGGGGPRKSDTATFYLWGLVGEKTLDLAQLCPEGVSTWRDYTGATDGLLTCLTCGIYAPRSIEVECAGPTGVGTPTTWRLTPRPAEGLTEARRVAGGRP